MIIKDLADECKCTGCSACVSICPTKAITLVENEEGFKYPTIDENLCTNCGLCKTVCYINNEIHTNTDSPACYAAAANDEIRTISTSGGIFTLLAEFILEKGGYVFGAAYDENWNLSHIFVDNKEDLNKLRGSKYFQSNMNNCFSKVKELLNKNSQVLFSGTPCQIAGLKLFLKKDYENLICVDILCHGVPSYKVVNKFLTEKYDISKIKNIAFRDKTQTGWSGATMAVSLTFSDGKVINDKDFYTGFLNNLFLRKCCGTCDFARPQRQGDITIGDFWGIEKIVSYFNDQKGISIILVNNSKGHALFGEIRRKFSKIEEVPLFKALKSGNGVLSVPSQHNPNRNYFFELLSKKSFKTSLDYALKGKYDVAIVGSGFSLNYGAILTNYAIYSIIKDMGYSVLMIDKPKFVLNGSPDLNLYSQNVYSDNPARQFMKKHMNLSKIYNTTTEIKELNEKCDIFIVPSDQVWNNLYFNKQNGTGNYFYLDFVNDNKKKIAYASSFGYDYWHGNYNSTIEPGYFLSKFDNISVREKSGVDVLKNTFGLSATHVLDPVFCADKEIYLNLIDNSNVTIPDKKYIFTYTLAPNAILRDTIVGFKNKTKMEAINALAFHSINVDKAMLNLDNMVTALPAEDFLSYIKNSELVVTNSFHAVCFSIILGKRFVCLPYQSNGASRFISILELLGLTDRIIKGPEDINEKFISEEINYTKINKILDEQKKHSLNWLKNALESEKSKTISSYNVLDSRIQELMIHNQFLEGNIKTLLNKVTELEKKINT